MIKCEAIEYFTLKDNKNLKEINKKEKTKNNEFSPGDTFLCDEKMAKYLLGNNPKGAKVIKFIEIIP